MMRLLIIEGFEPLRKGLHQHFSGHGFMVDAVINDDDGVWLAHQNTYDVVLLDLPVSWELSLETVQSIRDSHDAVLIITMGNQPLTPDDACELKKLVKHLLKPFSLADALGLVHSLAQSGGQAVVDLVKLGGIEMIPSRHEVRWENEIVHLEPVEFAVLDFLGRRNGEFVSRTEIWSRFFDDGPVQSVEMVDRCIRSLRRKLSAEVIRVRKRHAYKIEI